MSDLENKKKRVFETIQKFKELNPEVKSGDIDQLVNFLAASCMQMIVDNQERTGYADRAWWTIKESFEIDIEDESQMLPINRNINDIVQSKFDEACSNVDIEGIKEGLKNLAHINRSSEFGVLTDAAMVDNLEVLRFFIEDDFIKNNDFYRTQVDFHNQKGKLFSIAYFYDQPMVLEYLINEHNAEFTDKAKEILSRGDDFNHNDFLKEKKKQVISMIEKKHLSFMLEFDISNNETNNKKLKV